MGAVGVEAQVDPLWAAASLMRRHRFTEAVARCDEVLERNQLDQVRPPAPAPPVRALPCLPHERAAWSGGPLGAFLAGQG